MRNAIYTYTNDAIVNKTDGAPHECAPSKI